MRITTQSAGGGSATVSVELDEAPPTPPTGLTATAGFRRGEPELARQQRQLRRRPLRRLPRRQRGRIPPAGTQFHDSDAPVGDAHLSSSTRRTQSGTAAPPRRPRRRPSSATRCRRPPRPSSRRPPGSKGCGWNGKQSTDDYGVERYVVFRDGREIGTTPNTEFLDSFASAGEHTYVVYAEDEAENRSDASEPATATLAAREGPECVERRLHGQLLAHRAPRRRGPCRRASARPASPSRAPRVAMTSPPLAPQPGGRVGGDARVADARGGGRP